MTKIFIYAANPELAEQTAHTLKAAGAEHAEALTSVSITARQPKEHHYLFICETPAEKLASLVQKELPEAQYAEELGQWYSTQTQIMDAYQSQKKRAVLISTSTHYKNEDLIPRINNAWDLKLNIGEPSKSEPEQHAESDTLLAYLVQNLIQQTPPLLQLAETIAQSTGDEPGCYTESEAIDSYRNIKNIKSGYRQEIEATKSQVTQLQSLQEESELLLLQLHQVQEELERIYLEYQAYKETTEQEKTDLTAARDHHAHIAHELEQEIGRLHHEKAELTAARDHHAHIAHEREQEIGRLHQEKAELAAARENHDGIAALTAQFQKENESLREQSDVFRLQLHQVQDELERNFLDLQEIRTSEQQAQSRLQRIFQNNPAIFDYDSIEIKQIDGQPNSFKWVIKGLQSSVISRKHVSFETFVENLVLGIRFKKDKEHQEFGLTYWPESAKESSVVEIITAGKGNSKSLRVRTLCELSTLDWQLVKLLPNIIIGAFHEPNELHEPAARLSQGLQAFPKIFRYESVTLKRELANPDYEHLWLELQNASFGKYHWPKFEFRIGAADVSKNAFYAYPKLEIPLIDERLKPFDSWFEESSDDFGGKYELRFDVKHQIFDIEVWSKLNHEDQSMMLGLIKALQSLIRNHLKSKEAIRRGWNEWEDLAHGIALCASKVIL